MRVRTGIERIENTGATENSARIRKKGHKRGDIHATNCASENVITRRVALAYN